MGISVGSAVVQNTLRNNLRLRLTGTGQDVDEVSLPELPCNTDDTIDTSGLPIDRASGQRVAVVYRDTRPRYACHRTGIL